MSRDRKEAAQLESGATIVSPGGWGHPLPSALLSLGAQRPCPTLLPPSSPTKP